MHLPRKKWLKMGGGGGNELESTAVAVLFIERKGGCGLKNAVDLF